MPQLRQDLVTGHWVVIAPERAKRPNDFIAAEPTKQSSTASCPFCLHSDVYKKQRLKKFETEHIYVIPNSYPAFLEDPRNCSHRSYPVEDGFYNARPATGGHDVIIIKDHEHTLFDFTAERLTELMTMAKRRYLYWHHDCNTNYAMLIYNQGVQAGASIAHPHAQLFASNIIPNQVSRELAGSQHYYEERGSCVFCDIITHEQKQKVRVVAENASFLAVTCYAARFPFETWILPKIHQSIFEDSSPTLLSHLGEMMQIVIERLGAVLKQPALNFYLHDSPISVSEGKHYHWHLEVAPRVSTYGGYELGSGTIIDVMSPEDAAKYLRDGEQNN